MIGQIEYRKASTLEVRHAQRTIEMIAVPYNEDTEVLRADRFVTESVDPDALTPREALELVYRLRKL